MNLRPISSTAVRNARATVKLLAADWPAIEAAFTKPPVQERAELIDRALALWAAEKRAAAVVVPAARPAALLTEAGKLRQRAVRVLRLTAEGDAAVQRTLAQLPSGRWYEDRATGGTRIAPRRWRPSIRC